VNARTQIDSKIEKIDMFEEELARRFGVTVELLEKIEKSCAEFRRKGIVSAMSPIYDFVENYRNLRAGVQSLCAAFRSGSETQEMLVARCEKVLGLRPLEGAPCGSCDGDGTFGDPQHGHAMRCSICNGTGRVQPLPPMPPGRDDDVRYPL
jgi:hypothetical protein